MRWAERQRDVGWRLYEELYQSLTWDRGKEMVGHKRFTLTTDVTLDGPQPSEQEKRAMGL